MPDEIDLSGAVDMLKEMLGSEEGTQQIQNIAAMFGGGQETQKEAPPSAGMGFDNIEMMLKLQKVMSVMNGNANMRETAFLKSLRDLLRPERRGAVDNAVKFLSVGRAVKAFRELEGV